MSNIDGRQVEVVTAERLSLQVIIMDLQVTSFVRRSLQNSGQITANAPKHLVCREESSPQPDTLRSLTSGKGGVVLVGSTASVGLKNSVMGFRVAPNPCSISSGVPSKNTPWYRQTPAMMLETVIFSAKGSPSPSASSRLASAASTESTATAGAAEGWHGSDPAKEYRPH